MKQQQVRNLPVLEEPVKFKLMPEEGFDPGPDEEDQTYPQGPD